MKYQATFLVSVLFVSLLSACAGPASIDLAPDTLSQIRTISVIRSPEPKTYTIMTIHHAAAFAFGVLGGIGQALDQSSKQDKLSNAFKKQGTSIASNLAQKVSDKLNQIGYKSKVEDAPWKEVDGKYLLAFEEIQSDADAILIISPTIIGFVAINSMSDYLPTITSVVTLLGKNRKKILYKGFHASGWLPNSDGWKHTLPKSTFANFDEIMADTKASATSLENAASDIASTIAIEMKRKKS